jgi:pyruvate, water dikinase
MRWIRWFEELGLEDVPAAGGKNASLGEMIRELGPLGVRVPGGFATTSEAYWTFLRASRLEGAVGEILGCLRAADVADLERRSREIRELFASTPLPRELETQILEAYQELSARHREAATDVAVRSSATAEDLPTASFAGQHESFLNVRGPALVIEAVRSAYASLFTPRAISYRADMGFDPLGVALSVGVQKMVRSDKGSAGVIFTLDTETGHRGVVLVTSSWGLGETVVQGRVVPDQFYVHKETLRRGFRPIVRRKLGTKEVRLVYDADGPRRVRDVAVPAEERARFSLSDDDVLTLAAWALRIEEHYSRKHLQDTPMDIEWAKDGITGELFVVQARPETVHSQRKGPTLRLYRLREEGQVRVRGLAVGEAIAAGPVRVVRGVSELPAFQSGEVLVSVATDPDWEPVMKRAAAIVTDGGGRTSHAAIVARELGIPAVVGTGDATLALSSGATYTVCCAEGEVGKVYDGSLAFETEELDPTRLARPRTRMMLNVASPEKALGLSLLPNDGVGLARMEFIFADWVGIHPLALTRFDTQPPAIRREIEKRTAGYPDKREYFVDRLAQGIGMLAAAFWPKPVILRFSDFKTNEYARLLGGESFEPKEENPMLGWRGASRYYHPEYREGFLLEVAAVRRVREVFGLTNLAVMVPFCRTPAEGAQVLEVMRKGGLARGSGGLEVYVMAEIPSNALLAEDFAALFDGFSIGSNDLTQLTLGIDRDSARVAPLFDERSPAVKALCAMLIDVAHRAGRKVGICGQAPSDYPEFAAFLVERGIDSLSLNPDALVRTTLRVLEEERRIATSDETPARDRVGAATP